MLDCNDPQLARSARELLRDFAPPDPEQGGGALRYSLRGGGGSMYALYRDGEQVAASDDPQAVLGGLLWLISGDTVELAAGYILIHAGALVSPAGEAVLILGEAGSGKTTLVAALVQEGFGYLSDEGAAIHLGTGLAHPWPRPLGFRCGSHALARFASALEPHHGRGQTHVAIDRIRPGAVAGPAPVRHVIDHRYEPSAPTRLEPLSRAVGLVRMGSAAPRLRREGGRGLQALAAVMRGADAHSLVGGDLERSVSVVRELAGR